MRRPSGCSKAKQGIAHPLSRRIVRDANAAHRTKSQRVGDPEPSQPVKDAPPAHTQGRRPGHPAGCRLENSWPFGQVQMTNEAVTVTWSRPEGFPMKVRYGFKWFQGSMREVARLCLHAVFGSASLLFCMVPASALAQQQNAGRGINNRPLPHAPLLHSSPQIPAPQTPSPEGSASVAGTKLDVSGAACPGANVSLLHGDGTQLLTMVSEANCEFNFTKLSAGSYLVTVNAYGFAPSASTEFAVAGRQYYEVPYVSLSISPANMQ